MQLEIFCLCKTVELRSPNHLSLIDIFDCKPAVGGSTIVEPFVAIAAIRFFKTDEGLHQFMFKVTEESGRVLISSTEMVSISNLPTDSTLYCLQCKMGRTGLKVGTYRFSIESEGKPLSSIPLYIVPAAAGSASQKN